MGKRERSKPDALKKRQKKVIGEGKHERTLIIAQTVKRFEVMRRGESEEE